MISHHSKFFFGRALGLSGQVAHLSGLQLLRQAPLGLLVQGQHHVVERDQRLVVGAPLAQVLGARALRVHHPAQFCPAVLGLQAVLQPGAQDMAAELARAHLVQHQELQEGARLVLLGLRARKVQGVDPAQLDEVSIVLQEYKRVRGLAQLHDGVVSSQKVLYFLV